MSEHKECPSCCVTWEGEDIYEHFINRGDSVEKALKAADLFGWTPEEPRCFSINMHGLEYGYGDPNRYDGVSEWVCDVCGSRFGRWSGKVLQPGESEPRWGG